MVTRAQDDWDRFVPDLLAQTRAADEILVVIDRPSDPSEREAWKARHPQVTFLFNEANIGLTPSLNRGLAATRAEYIFRIDDDDQCRPTRIERQLACFEETGADLVCAWAEGALDGPGGAPWLISCPTEDAPLRAALERRNVIVHSSLAFRREAVAALGGYDETFRFAQDFDLYLRAIRAGLRFAGVGEPLVRRYYTKDSITVARRDRQILFSTAAKIVHCAETGRIREGLAACLRAMVLVLTPSWVRRWRRKLEGVTKRGR